MPPGAIELIDASLGFGATTALEPITLDIAQGETIALIGPNGSGKTSLLHLVAGLHEPTGGRVAVSETARPIALVAQRRHHRAFLPLTAAEVVRIGTYGRRGLLGRLTDTDERSIDEAVARLDIADLLDRQYGELSGGQQQRVILAESLVQQPSTLLLDEPITGLDLASQEAILGLIVSEKASDHTVIVSTHHLDEARHCERVVLLANRVVADGPPDEVLVAASLREAYGERLLGNHTAHGHDTSLLILDDHGHGTH